MNIITPNIILGAFFFQGKTYTWRRFSVSNFCCSTPRGIFTGRVYIPNFMVSCSGPKYDFLEIKTTDLFFLTCFNSSTSIYNNDLLCWCKRCINSIPPFASANKTIPEDDSVTDKICLQKNVMLHAELLSLTHFDTDSRTSIQSNADTSISHALALLWY